MGIRVTLRALAQAVFEAKKVNPAVVVKFDADAVPGNGALKFYGVVTVGAVAYELAGDNGKLKLFTDVDDFVKYIASAAPIGTGKYPVSINTGVVLAAAVPPDLVKAAANRVIKLKAYRVKEVATMADIDAQVLLMAGWEAGSPLQVAKLEETQAQRAAVVKDIAAIDAEIARLTP